MSVYILPALMIILLVYSAAKRVKVYDCFLLGAKDSLALVKSVFPYIAAIFVCIEAFKASGLSASLAKALEKPLGYLGIPSGIAELMLLVPRSGNGTVALLQDVIARYGVDSYPARCAAVISGASETTFYIAAVYFSQCKAKKLRYAIPVALFCSFIGVVVGCAMCRIL